MASCRNVFSAVLGEIAGGAGLMSQSGLKIVSHPAQPSSTQLTRGRHQGREVRASEGPAHQIGWSLSQQRKSAFAKQD